jgi:tetratricopeptide (TPR) repeat protein
VNVGAALQYCRRYDEALWWFDQALTLQPDHWQAFANRAAALIQLERYVEAQAFLDNATDAIVKRSAYWSAKGLLHTRRKEFAEALAAIKQASAIA